MEKPLKVNRVHITEFRFRIRGHTIEYGRVTKDVPDLVREPENANVSPNHPGDQREPVKIPDHVLTFKTVETTALRYRMTKPLMLLASLAYGRSRFSTTRNLIPQRLFVRLDYSPQPRLNSRRRINRPVVEIRWK